MVLFPQPAGPVTSHTCCSVAAIRPLRSDSVDVTAPLGFAPPGAMERGRRAVFGEDGMAVAAAEMSVDDIGAWPLTGTGVSQESMIRLCSDKSEGTVTDACGREEEGPDEVYSTGSHDDEDGAIGMKTLGVEATTQCPGYGMGWWWGKGRPDCKVSEKHAGKQMEGWKHGEVRKHKGCQETRQTGSISLYIPVPGTVLMKISQVPGGLPLPLPTGVSVCVFKRDPSA